MSYKKILIAIDSGVNSLKAAKAGFALAHQLRAEIGIIYVVDKAGEIVSADLGITPEQSKAGLEEAEKTIRECIALYDGIGPVARWMPEGLPAQEIIRIAAEWKADLIVMGTHGRSGLSRMLEGSTAEYVIRHGVIPVMVTPPGME